MLPCNRARVAEWVDAGDLKSPAERRTGSTPVPSTIMDSTDIDEALGLRAARRRAFELFEVGSSPADHRRLQHHLADSILAAEAHRPALESNRANRYLLKDHMRRLRSYGDAIAWQTLHPHTIRQLGKNDGQPPILSHQLPALDMARQCLDFSTEKGITTIVADLTNIIRIGDLIVVGHPEYPQIIELKASKVADDKRRLGRRGRQLSRMEGTIKYLRDGEAQVHGEPYVRKMVEVDTHDEYNDQAVREVLENALRNATAEAKLADFHYVIAVSAKAEIKYSNELVAEMREESVFLGAHSRPLQECWAYFRSPMIWDLPPELRWALMEEDVSLCHLLFERALIGYSNADGKILAITEDVSDEAMSGFSGFFVVQIHDTVEHLPVSSIHRVIYSNETVDSYCRWLIEAGKKSKEANAVE